MVITTKVSKSIVSWGRSLIIAATCGLLAFATLAFGAVHPWAYFSIGFTVALLSIAVLSLGLYKVLARPLEKMLLPYPPLWWLGLGLGLLVLAQLLSWPQGWVRWLSPAAWDIHTLGNGFAFADHLPLSLNPFDTLLESLKLWPAVVLFFLLIYTINSRRQILGLVSLILAVALFEVLYGFWQFRTHVIWGWKNPYPAGFRLCGTFINSNHLAFFLNMAILLGFGLFLSSKNIALQPQGVPGWDQIKKLSRSEHLEPQFKRFLLLFLLMLLTVGLIFTGSRGGMISLFVGFGLMAILIWGQRWKRGHIVLMVAFLVAGLLYSLFLGSAQLLARFQDVAERERYHAMSGAWTIFKDFPWTGSGIGTFGEVFYRYEPAELHGKYFIQTHNDWLQLLAETGIFGFSLVLTGWLLFFMGLVKQWRQRRDPFARYLALGGIGALGAAVIHALAEFPFHIPALCLVFASVAAITYLAVHSRQKEGWEYFSCATLKFPGRRPVTALILLVLIGGQVAFLGLVWYQWSAEKRAPTALNSTRKPPILEAKDFRQALSLSPLNSRMNLGLAEALEKEEKENSKALSEMENSYRAAIFHGPANWGYRLKLAEFYLRQQNFAPGIYIPAALRELDAAVKLFPESGALHFRLASVLTWGEKYYPGLIPPELRTRCGYHFQEAIKLEPQLQKYLK